MKRRILCFALCLVLMLSVCSTALAAEKKPVSSLSFNDDGSFKIMQVNDTQDTDHLNSKTVEFLNAALEAERPDLVVIAGDILYHRFIGKTPARIKAALNNIGKIFNDAKVPFAVTFGNHDHDLENVVSIKDMMNEYRQYEYCVWNEGCDPGTYNIPIMSSDGSRIAMNVYMMDTNNNNDGIAGVFPNQVEWYRQKSDELKAANGGNVVPSLLFQHIPVKEIYQLLKRVDAKQANRAVFRMDDLGWYKLDRSRIISDVAILGEAPCSEPDSLVTGQYEAWLEKGDIIGAFFGHDHVNNFVGRTEDGLILGYNGGAGFHAYGDGDKRSVRVFEINENDVENYTTRPVFYKDICSSIDFIWPSDMFTQATIGNILRWLLRMIGITE